MVRAKEKSILKKNTELVSLASLTNLLLKKYHGIIGKEDTKAPSIEVIIERIINYYEDIISCMPGNVYWLDQNGAGVGCNKNVLNMFGFTSLAQFRGLNFADMGKAGNWLPEATKSFEHDSLEVVKTGQAKLSIEEPPIPHRDGRTIYFLTSRVPLFNHNHKVIGVVGISIDITERKQMEQALLKAKESAEVANKAKSEFIAVASHELRTPLTAILGIIEILKDESLSKEKRQQYIEHLSQSSVHLYSLINDVLDFAKLEADKFELVSSPLNLKRLVEEIALMFTATVKARNIELFVEYEPGTPYQICSDSRALRQIFTNLIGNAIKFTNQGYIRIKVHCISQSAESTQLALSVEDTGIGIPADKLEIIFDRFQQVASAYTRSMSRSGTGLGLAITKKLVELMNGSITVASEAHKGSTFTCTFNFPLQAGAVHHSPWDEYKNTVRVLIVDDSTRGEVLKKQLGSNLVQMVSGEEAVDTLITAYKMGEPYDVLIIDKQLKTSDPYQILKMIQEQKYLPKPMPLLLITRVSLEDKKAIKAEGFFDSISKPVTPIILQSFLTSAWEHWAEMYCKSNKITEIEEVVVLQPPSIVPEDAVKKENSCQVLPKYPDKHKLVDVLQKIVNQKQIRCKILLVEDDAIIQVVHKQYLENLECEVTIATTGNEAIRLMAEDFDLVLMDIGLPDLNGFETTVVIRMREDGNPRVPIIGLTGYSDDVAREKCLAAGMDAILTKPIQLKELQEVIEYWVHS